MLVICMLAAEFPFTSVTNIGDNAQSRKRLIVQRFNQKPEKVLKIFRGQMHFHYCQSRIKNLHIIV